MQSTRLPTVQEIEELTAYLPRLYAEGFSPVENWEGGKKGADGIFTLPYPNYSRIVKEFFGLLGSDHWLDYGYSPERASEMLKDQILIKTASLSDVKTMLTFCVRGERFADGHWSEMIDKGHIRRLLERLNEIRSES